MTSEQLAFRRTVRRRRERVRHRRLALLIATGFACVGLLALALGLSGRGTPATVTAQAARPGPVAAPVDVMPSQAGGLPPNVVLAQAVGVDLHLPVDRSRLTAVAFRAVDDAGAVPLDPTGEIDYDVAPSDGRPGSETASVDVGAPAGTPVFSPVDGTIAAVSPYVVSGRTQGYQITISPRTAAGVVVTMNHLDAPPDGDAPTVGTPVRAASGAAIGTVRDFSEVAEQELARYTSDSGNHVHLELVRTGSRLFP
jgi:hypothetical protein